MVITPRDLSVLVALATYYTLTRVQVGKICFPQDDDGRITRGRLQKLLEAGLIQRARMEVVNPAMGAPAPVYYLAKKGAHFLAQESGDERFQTACTDTPNWQHLYHWVAVADFHILLDRAAALVAGVSVDGWLGEWSVANPDEKLPEKRYKLYTVLNLDKPRLVCVPDAAFLLGKDGFRKVFYLERDRDTTQPADRVAAQKAQGFAGLAERGWHNRHFPETNVAKFMVLMAAPTERRRDALMKAVASKQGADLWRFASMTDLTEQTLLTAPVWRTAQGEARSILQGGGAS